MSLLGILGFTAILGVILGIAGIMVTSGGRRRGMGLAIAAIPISVVMGAISAVLIFGIVFMARNAELIKRLEPTLSSSSGSIHDVANILHELGSEDFQKSANAERIEEWLREIAREHGTLVGDLHLKTPSPIGTLPTGEVVVQLEGEFVNGPASVRLTFAKENLWTPRIDDIDVGGLSPRGPADKNR